MLLPLARFTRNLARRSPSVATDLCANMTFVLDRWHKQKSYSVPVVLASTVYARS